MSGSATLTTVRSSSSMNVAADTAPSIHHRLGRGASLARRVLRGVASGPLDSETILVIQT
jgi:hypothetical protein